MEKLEPLDIAGGDVTGLATVESSLMVSEPLDIESPCGPATPTPGAHPDPQTGVQDKHVCTNAHCSQ